MAIRQNAQIPVDRLAQLNDPADVFKNPAQLGFIRVLVDVIRGMARDFIGRDTATPHFMLLSPNGTAYRVTVSDTGVLTTENARAPQ